MHKVRSKLGRVVVIGFEAGPSKNSGFLRPESLVWVQTIYTTANSVDSFLLDGKICQVFRAEIKRKLVKQALYLEKDFLPYRHCHAALVTPGELRA